MSKLIAVVVIALGSLGFVASASADCGANHSAQASTSDSAAAQANSAKPSGG